MKLALALLVSAACVAGAGACVSSAVYTHHVESEKPPAGRFVETPGGRVHVIEAGEDGPVVMMIHGASANAREFTGSLAPLLDDDHRVLMADRPGHGYSKRVDDAEQLGVQARQMALALEALAPGERAVVVGHSFGGAVALRLALDRPDLTKGLVLLAPVSHDWGGGGGAWYNEFAGPPVIGHAFSQVAPIVGPGRAKDGVEGVFHPQEAPDGYYENAGIGLLFRPANFRANARDVNALRDELIAQQSRYSALEAPVVVFSGSKDTVIVPHLHAARLEKEVPDIEVVRLPETGHMPHHAHGADIAAVIARLARPESVQTSELSTD